METNFEDLKNLVILLADLRLKSKEPFLNEDQFSKEKEMVHSIVNNAKSNDADKSWFEHFKWLKGRFKYETNPYARFQTGQFIASDKDKLMSIKDSIWRQLFSFTIALDLYYKGNDIEKINSNELESVIFPIFESDLVFVEGLSFNEFYAENVSTFIIPQFKLNQIKVAPYKFAGIKLGLYEFREYKIKVR